MSETQPVVLIVDDDTMLRSALTQRITSNGHAVRGFGSANEFLESRSYLEPGCVLLDLRLPDLDGFELQRQLRDAGASTPVIFMSGFADIPTSVRAMKEGAFDFLPKPIADAALLTAISNALELDLVQRQQRVEGEELRTRVQSLTPRELDVFRLVLQGRLNKQIARELGISEKTVKVHRGRVMSKLQAKRIAQLVQIGARLGYVP